MIHERSAPDLIVANATIGPAFSDGVRASAVAIRAGRITALGADDEIRPLADQQTVQLDAGGRRLLPAFTDSHTHFRRASILRAHFLDFDEIAPRRLEDVVAAVRRRAEGMPPGSWIQGDNLSPWRLDDRKLPDRHALDAATSQHPVLLRGVGKHFIVANSLALRLAGIGPSTEDPPGGKIDREADSFPSGVLHERAKLRLDADRADTVVPPVTEEHRIAALHAGIRQLHRLGITAIHEIVRAPDELRDFLLTREAHGDLLRVIFYVRAVEAATRLEYITGLGLQTGFGDDWMRLGGVKVSVDGSLTLRNAALYDPYPDDPDNHGIERLSAKELGEIVAESHDHGLQVAVHAIGQRAVDIALDAYQQLYSTRNDAQRMRHRIEHAYLPPREGQLQRFALMGLILSTQPANLLEEGEVLRELMGTDDLTGYMPIRSAVRHGIKVLINSDFPCATNDPWAGIQAAVARTTASGMKIDPTEAVDQLTALRMAIENPAFAEFREATRGAIRPGAFGDLILISSDVLMGDEWGGRPEVDLTVVGGRIVHAAPGVADRIDGEDQGFVQ